MVRPRWKTGLGQLRGALSFLTILPTAGPTSFEPGLMLPLFPLIGLIIGGLLACFDALAGHIWPRPVSAILNVVFLVIITGGFHLDGLGDTADGLFSHRSRTRALEIMKDSRLGTMGLLAVVLVLTMKGASMMVIDRHRFISLLIIPAYARTSVIFGIRYLPYGRPEGGTGADFFKSPPTLSAFGWLLPPLLLSILLGKMGLIFNAVFVSMTVLIILFYKYRINGITGDMLGAMVEVTETALFLTVAAAW